MMNREQIKRDEEIAMSRSAALSRQKLDAWLRERRDNCLRIANFKEGKERQEWLDDAAFFIAALHLTVSAAND